MNIALLIIAIVTIGVAEAIYWIDYARGGKMRNKSFSDKFEISLIGLTAGLFISAVIVGCISALSSVDWGVALGLGIIIGWAIVALACVAGFVALLTYINTLLEKR
jgi:hypothetical protein